MKAWTLKIAFAGGGTHTTRDVRVTDPGWGAMDPRHAIEALAFGLPTGHRVRLAGFEAYNFFIEASRNLAGGPARLEAVWLCGRADGQVNMWRIGGGRVVHDVRPSGHEWGGGPTRGWLAGTPARRVSEVVP